MKVVIVWAHPEAHSFNRSLVDLAQRSLSEAGHLVRTTDLYGEGFEAVASQADFRKRQRPDRLVYDDEQFAASQGGGFDCQIEKALEDLEWCDLLILQFPLWWFSVPAIMKGWIDRVMAKGIAYGGGRWYDRGGFTGRRALLSLTTAAYPEMYSPNGINGAMDVILWPLQHGVLRFCGFEALSPHIIWTATYSDDATRGAAMDRYRERLRHIENERGEPFHARQDFDERWQLKTGISPVTIGHQLGDRA